MSTHTNWLGEFFKHSLLLVGAVVVLLPFYLMLSYSLKSPAEIKIKYLNSYFVDI